MVICFYRAYVSCIHCHLSPQLNWFLLQINSPSVRPDERGQNMSLAAVFLVPEYQGFYDELNTSWCSWCSYCYIIILSCIFISKLILFWWHRMIGAATCTNCSTCSLILKSVLHFVLQEDAIWNIERRIAYQWGFFTTYSCKGPFTKSYWSTSFIMRNAHCSIIER